MFIDDKELPSNILKRWFGDPHTPIDIEVGSATGKFLCRSAQRLREVRFIGLEINRVLCLEAAERAHKLQLSNVMFVSMDAKTFLTRFVPSNMIREVHIYFPTPYPKDYRIIDQNFADQIYRVLRLDGTARVITDHKEYFEQISACFNSQRWQHVSWSEIGEKRKDGLLVGTPAEVRYGGKYVVQVLK